MRETNRLGPAAAPGDDEGLRPPRWSFGWRCLSCSPRCIGREAPHAAWRTPSPGRPRPDRRRAAALSPACCPRVRSADPAESSRPVAVEAGTGASAPELMWDGARLQRHPTAAVPRSRWRPRRWRGRSTRAASAPGPSPRHGDHMASIPSRDRLRPRARAPAWPGRPAGRPPRPCIVGHEVGAVPGPAGAAAADAPRPLHEDLLDPVPVRGDHHVHPGIRRSAGSLSHR